MPFHRFDHETKGRRPIGGVLVALALLLLPGWATAASSAATGGSASGVTLQPRSPIAPRVAAFPSVGGAGAAVAAINRGLGAIEAQLRGAMRDCRAQAKESNGSSGWTRTVTVTTNGPSLLSFLVQDDTFCGGPYPNSEHLALVYDLRSGQPVNWLTLLPKRFGARSQVSPGLGGSATGLVVSPQMLTLYRRLYPARVPDVDPEMRDTCRDSVEDGFTLWPDAASHSLMLEPTAQNHAAAACAVPVGLTASVLREFGAAEAVLQTLGME